MRSAINAIRCLATLLCLLAATACAHSKAVARPATAFHAFECPANDDHNERGRAFGAALQLALDVDYLEVLSHGGGHDQMIVVERGTPCSGATDATACKTELNRQKQAWVQAHPDCEDCDGGIVVTTTHNDQVVQYANVNELLTLLGPIDAPADAWLLLMMHTRYGPYACGDESWSGYRVVPEGFELLRRELASSCRPIEVVQIVERFNRDGSIDHVRRTVVEYQRDGCFHP